MLGKHQSHEDRATHLSYLYPVPEEEPGREDVTGLRPAPGKGLMRTDAGAALCFQEPGVSSGDALISLK